MCGIAGYINLDGQPASVGVLQGMLNVQRHRGPDDQGMRLFSLKRMRSVEPAGMDEPLDEIYEGALGFNRLSILDLSPRGHQPMCNREKTVFIAFNGEIYNAFDYRSELEAAGYEFRSRTDTEVILYLYEEYGIEEMLERLNGMFAIVIVDLQRRQVHLARDHFGIKPFYWSVQNGVFFFSSEVKSFLAHPQFRPELDPAHLDEFLAFRYCAGERHLLKDVVPLLPGHRVTFGAEGIQVRRYWEIPDETNTPAPSFDAAADQLEVLLRQSVRSQLLSDVKVGCQLSGGIDSSLVTLFARTHFHADMDTFSIVFEDADYSEEPWITQAALRARADSHRFLLTEESFFECLEDATWHLDQPLNHPNSLGIYLLAQKARKLVTVLLSGEGADELFGGYPRFYYAALRPRVMPFLDLLCRFPRLGPRFSRAFGTADEGHVASFIAASRFQELSHLRQLRPGADFGAVVEQRTALFDRSKGSMLSRFLKYEMQTYMPDLLVRQDKMTMAHSMENRVPFLDRHLVSFVRTLPPQYLVGSEVHVRQTRMRNTKKLLKALACRTFGQQFTFRRKSGFALPLYRFYQQKRFVELMEDQVLPGIRRRQIVQPEAVESWWRNRQQLRPPLDEVLWVPIALELWTEAVLDHGQSAASPTQERQVCLRQ